MNSLNLLYPILGIPNEKEIVKKSIILQERDLMKWLDIEELSMPSKPILFGIQFVIGNHLKTAFMDRLEIYSKNPAVTLMIP